MLHPKKSSHLKAILRSFSILLLSTQISWAQEFKETVQPLSSKAIKGYVYDVSKDNTGNTNITYKMKLDKKSEVISFEKYSFDKDIKFIATTDVQETKETNPDRERTYLYANVGGSTSFDVLSMKLKINKVVRLQTWNHEKQIYINKKTISNETIKPKNDAGKVYLGYASYSSEEAEKPGVFILAKTEGKKKTENDAFYILMLNDQLELKETPLDLSGSYSLEYCEQVKNENVIMIFAPNEGAADLSKYIYYEYDITGKQLVKTSFTSPSSALLITSIYQSEGNIYCFGTSAKTKEAFSEVYNEYAPIYNPGYTEGGNNLKDFKWRKALDESMDNFHLLKFIGSELVFLHLKSFKLFPPSV